MKLTPRQKLYLLRHYFKWKRYLRRNPDVKITLTQIMQMIDAALALAAMGVKLTPSEKDDEILAKIVELREKVRPLFGADAPEATEVELTTEQAGDLKLAIADLQAQCDGCCNG